VLETLVVRAFCFGLVGLLATLSQAVIGLGADRKDIVDTAVGAGSFKTLVAAVNAADLVDTLKGPGPFTVFAPTDEAFAKLPEGTVESLLKPENKSQLVAILKHHVVAGRVGSAQVVKRNGVTSLSGQRLAIATDDGVRIDAATVMTTDIDCANGVIHIIDTVLMPSFDTIPEVAAKGGVFNTLLTAAKAAGLVDALSGPGPLTVFAPTDEAFAKLPPGTIDSLLKPENKGKLVAILKDHVVSGRIDSTTALTVKKAETLRGTHLQFQSSSKGAFVNDAQLVTTDIQAKNGVIHVIDTVIMPKS